MLMQTIHRWMACSFATIVLLIAAALMDGPSDAQQPTATSQQAHTLAAAAHDAATTPYASAQADQGRALCAKHNAQAVWTNQGHLICRPLTTTNPGAQP